MPSPSSGLLKLLFLHHLEGAWDWLPQDLCPCQAGLCFHSLITPPPSTITVCLPLSPLSFSLAVFLLSLLLEPPYPISLLFIALPQSIFPSLFQPASALAFSLSPSSLFHLSLLYLPPWYFSSFCLLQIPSPNFSLKPPLLLSPSLLSSYLCLPHFLSPVLSISVCYILLPPPPHPLPCSLHSCPGMAPPAWEN